jgi:hypothetical protein
MPPREETSVTGLIQAGRVAHSEGAYVLTNA